MDRERAERHLRLLCDRTLRRASDYLDGRTDALDDDPRFTAVAPLASPAPPRIVIRDCLAGVQDVADALIAVEAIDEERADAIMIQLAEALAIRSGTGAALLPRDVYRLAGRHPNQAPRNQAAAAAELRVAPVGRLVHLQHEGMAADLYLMAAVVMPGMTALTMAMHIRRPADPSADLPVSPAGRPFPGSLSATDDLGGPYGLSFSGMPGPEDWDGFLDVHPPPPAGISWLDLVAGEAGDVTHIDLAAGSPAAEVVAEPRLVSPGERLLIRVAERLLAGGGLGWWPAPAVENFGEIVTALIEVGALPPGSPLPVHLAALGECLGRVDHGITVTTVPDGPQPGADGLRIPGLPQPWADVLGTYDGKGRPLDWPGAPAARRAPATQTAVAAVAVVLPEIDGVRFAVAGLHSGWHRNVLYVVATGLPAPRPGPPGSNRPDSGFSWWVRDSAGRWHVGASIDGHPGASGELRLNLSIAPPLGPETSEIELVVTGPSARVRARLPLRWHVLGQ
jgi:hypothetical protein